MLVGTLANLIGPSNLSIKWLSFSSSGSSMESLRTFPLPLQNGFLAGLARGKRQRVCRAFLYLSSIQLNAGYVSGIKSVWSNCQVLEPFLHPNLCDLSFFKRQERRNYLSYHYVLEGILITMQDLSVFNIIYAIHVKHLFFYFKIYISAIFGHIFMTI